MNKAKEILNFQEYWTKFWTNTILRMLTWRRFQSGEMIFLQKSKSCLIFVDRCNNKKVVIKVFR